ncbi:MAG: hypothetical protein RL458_619, partial [Pseudomonadota bacterium]
AGRIETGAELLLRGQNVQVEGMLRSSRATAQEDDHELRILAIQDLRVLADVRVSGSAKLSAGRDIRVDNATITAGAAGQSLTLTAGRNLSLGNVDPVAGDLAPHAVILAADRSLELRATSDLRLAADALASVSAAAGELRLVAGSMHLVGELLAGARVDAATGNSTWSGPGALIELDASSGLTIGGPGLDPNAALTDVGATLAASGELRIAAGADANDVALTLTPRSSLTSNARFDPAWTGGPSRIQVQASGLVNLEGTVRAIDSGADISIATDSLVIVDGLVSANDSLSIGAGSHHTRLGLVVKPFVASPDPGGSPRGGVLDVASGGSISLSAIDGIELSGIVGQIEAAQTLASSVSVASAAGDVSVTGSIDVKDSLTISALQIAILAGGHAEASGRDSRAFLNASQSMLLAAAQGANPLATVRAGATAHLVAPVAIVAGLVEATRTADATRPLAAERTGGQVLLHADTQLTITGLLRAQGNVALMAGADTQLPRATLEAGLALNALGEGVIEVLDAGGISAGGEFSARTGGEFRLLSAVELLGNVTMLRPAVQVVSEAVEVVRGSRDVAIGTIQRTVFTTATTTVIEKLRDVEVKIGKSFQSMEVTLTQAGYYNPSEPNPERKFREYFVEGVDYLNSQIDWSDAGSEALPNRQATAPGLTYLDTGYRTFNQLNDAQRQAVLNHLGYMPLYDLSYASGSIGGGDASVPGQVYEHTSLNTATGALTTSVKRTPTWAAAPLTIYHVDVAGWRDKYVRMPMGAQESIYRLVSQGEARYLTGDTTLNGLSDGNWQNAVNAGVIYSLPNGSGPVTTFALGTAYNGRTYANDQIDWAAYGAVAPAAGALFDTLSENQRLAVIGHLGYVRQSDPVIGEFVAEYTDRAQVKYSQVTSVYDQAATGWPTKTVVFLPGTPFELSLVVPEFNDPHDAVEDGPARWAASYVASSGQRLYRVAGRPELTLGGVTYTDTEARSPDWFWQSGPGFVTADTAPASTTYQLGRATNLLRAYPNWVTALDSDTATFTQVGTPVVRPDQVALTFKHWTDPTYFVDMWVDNDDGSQWGSQNWDDEDEVPRFSYEIFNKYSNPQQSANAGYVDGVLRLVASGHDAKYLNNNTGKWTAGTLAALTGTSGVINPATNAPYAAFAERIKATVRYAKDNDTPTGSGDGIYVTVTGQDRLNGQIKETFNDYTYQWTSKTKKVYDQRLQLNYQLTWRDQDVMGSREVWAPVTREILLPVFEDQTVWERQAVLGTEVLTRTRVGERAETLAAAGYDTVAVAARDIVIETGGPARLGGVLNATRDLRVHTLDALTVQGTTLAGAQLDSVAQLTAGQTLSLEAAGTLTLSESAFVDGRTIDLESGGRMAVAGVVGSVPRAATSSQPAHPGTLSVSIRSDAALSLDAAVYATDSIQVLAGQHAVARFGGITAGSNAQLRTTADGSDIVLRAGQSGGHLQLDGSLLSARGLGSAIELSADSGRITQTRGAQGGATAGLLQGEVIASALVSRSAMGIALNTEVSQLTATVSKPGDIEIANALPLEVVSATTFDGAISIVGRGTIVATDIRAGGSGDASDIRVISTGPGPAGSSPAQSNVLVGRVTTPDRGDVLISAKGEIRQIDAGSPVILADQLELKAGGAIGLATHVRGLSVQTLGIGNVVIDQRGTREIDLRDSTLMNGSLTLTADAAVTVSSLQLLSNDDDRNVRIETDGDLALGLLVAGVYLETGQPLPVLAQGAPLVRVSSAGRVTLLAGGRITEAGLDNSVDLVADHLEARAALGIEGLEVALNSADLQSTSGHIQLSDRDGVGESAEGLILRRAATSLTADSRVDISAQGNLLVEAGALVQAVHLRLSSREGDLQVAKPSNFPVGTQQPHSGDSLKYGRSVSFVAPAGTVDLYRFFNADAAIEYRAGVRFLFGTDASNRTGLVPGDLTSDSIILETGEVLSINGSISARKRLELISARDVLLSGNLAHRDGGTARIEQVTLIAKGLQPILSAVNLYGSAVNQLTQVSQLSGHVRVDTISFPVSTFELRALRDVEVRVGLRQPELTGRDRNLTLSGFVGGLQGFGKAENVNLVVHGTLTVVGGIIGASKDIDIRASEITSDGASVFIADQLDVRASNSIQVNTLVESVTAVSEVSGSISINEADNLYAELVAAESGSIDVAAGGYLWARDVYNVADGTSLATRKNITLSAARDLYVDRVEAAVSAGAQKVYNSVVLDARGLVRELPALKLDANQQPVQTNWKELVNASTGAPVTNTQWIVNDDTNADAFGFNVQIRQDDTQFAFTQLASARDRGSATGGGFELRITDSTLAPTAPSAQVQSS